MRLRMLQTRRGSPDGRVVRQYHAGEVYDLPPILVREFLDKGYAEVEGWEIPKGEEPKTAMGRALRALEIAAYERLTGRRYAQ